MVHSGLVADRFELMRCAGSGGMGEVWCACDRLSGGTVALKRLHLSQLKGAERFMREARVLSELAHHAIVRYVAHGVTPGGEPYLAMEWLDGETLDARLQRGPLTLEDAIAVITQVAEALAAAHERGVVHRDIKPGNLMLVSGEQRRVKVLDFGLARFAETAALTRTGTVMGTVGYMAPEQALGTDEPSPAVDVFSLGCVFYECLTATPPFTGDNLMAVLAKVLLDDAPRLSDAGLDVPGPIEDLAARLMSKDLAQRPADGRAALEAIAAAADATGDGAARPAPARISKSLGSGERRWLSLVVIAPLPASHPGSTVMEAAPELRSLAGSSSGIVHTLADGTQLVTVHGIGRADEQAVRAARIALAWSQLRPHARMAFATSAGEAGAGIPVGQVVDRAAALLARGVAGIALDDVSMRLLERRFVVQGGMLIGERDTLEPERRLLGQGMPCLGREREIALLEATLAEVVAEPVPSITLLVGPPGIGKSRIAQEIQARAQSAHGMRTLVARGDPLYAGSPLGLVRQLVEVASVGQGLGAHVEALLGPGEAAARVAEVLGALTRGPTGAPWVVGSDAMNLAEEMQRAFEDWIGALGRQQPLLIVLEDLHWGDVSSAAYIVAALRRHGELPIACLGLSRPEGRELLPALWSAPMTQELKLLALSRRAAERLVRRALPAAGDEVVARVVERAAGNAFYLEELVRHVAERRDAGALPETVLILAQARLEQLGAEARRVLRAASVFGETCWSGGVRALAGDGLDVAAHLEALVASEVLGGSSDTRFAGEREYVFRHGLLRDAAYATLTDGDRALGHRLAGDWLEAAGERDAHALAAHFELANEPARAAPWLLRCAELADLAQDVDGALRLAHRAGELTSDERVRSAALRHQARLLTLKGLATDAGLIATEALRNCGGGGREWMLPASVLVFSKGMRGEAEEAIALAREFTWRQCPAQFSMWEACQIFVVPWTLMYLGERELCREVLERLSGIPAETPEDEPSLRGWQLWGEAHFAMFSDGDPWRTYALATRGTELLRNSVDATASQAVLQAQGAFLLNLGDYEEGERLLERALADTERSRVGWAISWARLNYSLAPFRRRALDETRALQAACVRENEERGVLLLEGIARSGLATTLARMGDIPGAKAELELSLAKLRTFPPMRAMALAVRAQLQAQLGAADHALTDARAALALISRHGTWIPHEYLARLAEAESLFALGRADEAREAIGAARVRLLDRAARIPEVAMRDRFLTRVRVNARILELAWAWHA